MKEREGRERGERWGALEEKGRGGFEFWVIYFFIFISISSFI